MPVNPLVSVTVAYNKTSFCLNVETCVAKCASAG